MKRDGLADPVPCDWFFEGELSSTSCHAPILQGLKTFSTDMNRTTLRESHDFMSRTFNEQAFNSAFKKYIVQGRFQEIPEYYPRYRSRYRAIIQECAERLDEQPKSILDIGGGQHALLLKVLYGDKVTVADLPGPHLEYLRSLGVETVHWNLCSNEQPFQRRFDLVIFSEVIEHLPIPAHVVFSRIRMALKPRGLVLVTTPNLSRLRNVVYMMLGKRIYDYFRIESNQGLGHVIEYSADHLRWQLETAGFREMEITFRQFHHQPNHLLFRFLSLLGYPLFVVPRFRDQLMVVAASPRDPQVMKSYPDDEEEARTTLVVPSDSAKASCAPR